MGPTASYRDSFTFTFIPTINMYPQDRDVICSCRAIKKERKEKADYTTAIAFHFVTVFHQLPFPLAAVAIKY
jgi:hypothetical protein